MKTLSHLAKSPVKDCQMGCLGLKGGEKKKLRNFYASSWPRCYKVHSLYTTSEMSHSEMEQKLRAGLENEIKILLAKDLAFTNSLLKRFLLSVKILMLTKKNTVGH